MRKKAINNQGSTERGIDQPCMTISSRLSPFVLRLVRVEQLVLRLLCSMSQNADPYSWQQKKLNMKSAKTHFFLERKGFGEPTGNPTAILRIEILFIPGCRFMFPVKVNLLFCRVPKADPASFEAVEKLFQWLDTKNNISSGMRNWTMYLKAVH